MSINVVIIYKLVMNFMNDIKDYLCSIVEYFRYFSSILVFSLHSNDINQMQTNTNSCRNNIICARFPFAMEIIMYFANNTLMFANYS